MHISDGLLTVRRVGRDIPIAQVTPAARIAGLRQHGHSEAIASAIVDGALGSRLATVGLATVGLARAVGLVAKVETGEARDRGLVK